MKEEMKADDELPIDAGQLCMVLYDALREAKRTIKVLHGNTGWDIYNANSPEMKRINEALNKYEG